MEEKTAAGENTHFDQQKASNLSRADLSKKGSIDEPIVNLVTSINESIDFFTTSSCSGRVILYSFDSTDQSTKSKSNCRWHFTSHQPLEDIHEFHAALDQAKIDCPHSELTLKFEPFILHAQCRTLAKAKLFHNCSLECGFRNSGLTLGKGGKVTVAVRGTLCLEIPFGQADSPLVSEEYLRYLLLEVVRDKFKVNFDGIKRFEEAVKDVLCSQLTAATKD